MVIVDEKELRALVGELVRLVDGIDTVHFSCFGCNRPYKIAVRPELAAILDKLRPLAIKHAEDKGDEYVPETKDIGMQTDK